ncbi:hypothetical protein MRX96_044031 [Rhipicephalus microplus]
MMKCVTGPQASENHTECRKHREEKKSNAIEREENEQGFLIELVRVALVASEEERNPCDSGHDSHRSVFSSDEQHHTTHHLRATRLSGARGPCDVQWPASDGRWKRRHCVHGPGHNHQRGSRWAKQFGGWERHYSDPYRPVVHGLRRRNEWRHTTKNAEVIAHVKNPQGEAKLLEYWNRNVFHHAVLDLEVKPWEHLEIQTEVRAVFDLLKGGFIVLGIRIWPANKTPFLGNVTEQMEHFPLDGFVPWTHFTEDEFQAKYPECVITGTSPIMARNTNNSLDMFEVLDWVNSSITWNIYPSLAISVSMCPRIYLTSTGTKAQYGDKCVDNHTPPGPFSMYCNDPKKYFHTFETRYPELTVYSYNLNYSEYMATFENQAAVNEKICEVKYRYEFLDISLALFDIECEDWADVCDTTDNNVVKGRNRIDLIYQYTSGMSLEKLKSRSIPDCP